MHTRHTIQTERRHPETHRYNVRHQRRIQIAEADLKLRGPGDLEGTQQSGMAFDLKIADIARDGQLVQLARDEARNIIEADPTGEKPEYAMLWNHLKEQKKDSMDWSSIS